MKDFKLGATTYLKSVAIRVKDRDKMIAFYKDTVGFDLKREENELAIFGTQDSDSEMLLLEESPRANNHTGEIKKLSRFSLVIPSVEEMADMLCRIRKTNYPIKDALEDQARMGILLVDPESNELEIYYEEKNAEKAEPEVMDQEALLRKSEEKFTKLTSGAYFEKIHLNVSDLAKERQFLSHVLGLKVHNEENGLHVLNEGDFHVGLNQAVGGTIDLPTDEVLGLDFLKFVVTPENMETLIEHLQAENLDFFVDKKKSVITVYDAIGIEWWFVSNPKK
ncbi:extradiol dioxygenase [Enterococcus thailandicus]|uniref:Extradiol dioxygenase n=2 Tax=root TaxID=1 RepID=A0A510WFE5_ENTTH|nr:VOC family protein [Enterococcus thailandicus]MDK4352639.1 VOC family protein [Enterococcus thailandicus]MDT2734907.1 CppA N-terminal domain-containing protein [Enterococcus thailandicus]MDT2751878.1 CppA N-terminal domain-containing protein [Enterococcus thailandicus]MDT2776019.1 CppA N-terminal domain-containing protein [Enterococcus thailandicus]MDT2846886.1 CppA N-terminal domain-containing protein [Enterococcus thailandicus]